MAGAEQETTTLEGRLQQNETDRTADALSVAALEQEMQEVRTGLLEKNQARVTIQAPCPRSRAHH